MPSKEVEIKEIGKVTLRKNPRAKHITISIKPFKGVSIILPRWVSYLEGERILNNRIDWIKKHLPKIKSIEKENLPQYDDGAFVTKHHQIFFKKSDSYRISCTVRNQKVIISTPTEKTLSTEELNAIIKIGIERALRVEAKNYLPKRIIELSEKNGFTFEGLSIKNIKSRWGSCSYKNNINLSIHLMRLPFELIDYVILHELVHTKIKNHSAKFWNELEKVFPNSKLFDKELRKYGKYIY